MNLRANSVGRAGEGRTIRWEEQDRQNGGSACGPIRPAHKASWWRLFQMKASGGLTFNVTVLHQPYYKAERGGVTLRPEIP